MCHTLLCPPFYPSIKVLKQKKPPFTGEKTVAVSNSSWAGSRFFFFPQAVWGSHLRFWTFKEKIFPNSKSVLHISLFFFFNQFGVGLSGKITCWGVSVRSSCILKEIKRMCMRGAWLALKECRVFTWNSVSVFFSGSWLPLINKSLWELRFTLLKGK